MMMGYVSKKSLGAMGEINQTTAMVRVVAIYTRCRPTHTLSPATPTFGILQREGRSIDVPYLRALTARRSPHSQT